MCVCVRVSEWVRECLSQIVRRSEDRDDWRSVVAKAGAANFEHGDADRWQVTSIMFINVLLYY